MKDDITEWRLELDNVPGGRSAIQFHFGRDAAWSKGCIIVGANNRLVCGRDECAFSDSPRDGIRVLRDFVTSRMIVSNERVSVEIR